MTAEAERRWIEGDATTQDFADAGLQLEVFLRYAQAPHALRQAAGLTLLARQKGGCTE